MSIYQSPSAPFPAKWVHLADHPKKAPTLRYHQASRSWDSRLRLWNTLTVWYHLMKKVKSLTFRIHLYKVTGLLVRQFQKPPRKDARSSFRGSGTAQYFLSFYLLIIYPKSFHYFRLFCPKRFCPFFPMKHPPNYLDHAPLITTYFFFQPHHLMLKASEVRREDMMQCITTRERNLIHSIHRSSLQILRRHPNFLFG